MNVLITRPDQRGQELVQALNDKGIFALQQPLFRIEAGSELLQLPALLGRLNAGDYLFAVSKNAIDFASQTLKETGFHFRNDLHYFAVGRTSANHFASLAEQAVKYPIKFENSEGVLDLPEMQQLEGKQLLILRGNGGREQLAEMATARGAKVAYVECYRRLPLDENLSEKISLAKRVGVDTIVATSGEILNALVEQTADKDKPWLFDCRLVTVGQRLSNLAKRLGWQPLQIMQAPKADNQSLLDVLTAQL